LLGFTRVYEALTAFATCFFTAAFHGAGISAGNTVKTWEETSCKTGHHKSSGYYARLFLNGKEV